MITLSALSVVTCWVVVSEENFGDGLSAILAGIACLHDGRDVVLDPFN